MDSKNSSFLQIEKTLQSYLASDKIMIVSNGIRGMGYLIRYLLQNDRAVPPNLLSQFVRVSLSIYHYDYRMILGISFREILCNKQRFFFTKINVINHCLPAIR